MLFPDFKTTPLLCNSKTVFDGSLGDPSKRSKRSLRSKIFKVEISYAAKVPLKSVSHALQGAEPEYVQDALRVLDIILRQQAAKRYSELSFELYVIVY